MRESEQKEIGGSVYTVQQMPGMAAFKMLNRLARVLGPGLAALGSMKPGTTVGDLDLAQVAQSIPLMLAELPEQVQEDMTKKLLDGCLVDGVPLLPRFDVHFRGRPLVAAQVVMFALQVNFGSFRDALAASGIRRGTGAPSSVSETSNTSAGQPNA